MITHVAIRFNDIIYSLPKPNRHNDVIRHIVEVTGCTYVNARDDDQGFLDDTGRFLRRAPALRIAKECNQLKEDCMGLKLGKLYSEDVW